MIKEIQIVINEKEKLSKILNLRELRPVRKYIMFANSPINSLIRFAIGMATPEKLRQQGQDVEAIKSGLERLKEIACSKEKYVYHIYKDIETKEDSQKKDVVLIHFPAEKRKPDSPYIINIPGGAYQTVCTLHEGFPVAAKWNELGYDCFILNYRVGGENVIHKSIDDLAQAVRFIQKNDREFGVKGDNYIVGGFSAGGNLTGQWATVNHGFAAHGLPAPKALYTIYPAVNSALYLKDSYPDEKARKTMEKNVKGFLKTMFGANADAEYIRSYDVDTNIDANCPPSFIAACEDDETVLPVNSKVLKQKLDELGVPAVLEMGQKGGHGFGVGNLADVKGWMDRADDFFKQIESAREKD